jgi:hypothetical protein
MSVGSWRIASATQFIHYAIVRPICSQLGIDVPKEFGVAPSTLKYKSSMAAD